MGTPKWYPLITGNSNPDKPIFSSGLHFTIVLSTISGIHLYNLISETPIKTPDPKLAVV